MLLLFSQCAKNITVFDVVFRKWIILEIICLPKVLTREHTRFDPVFITLDGAHGE